MSHQESVTYEELPALCIRGRQLRGSLRIVTMACMFGTVWAVGIGGTTVLNLGYLAGFTDIHWGVLSGLAFAATLAQLPGSYHIERTGRRKQLFLVAGITGRLLWIVVGLMPVALLLWADAPASRTVITWTALAAILCAYGLGQLAMPSWTTWMADLIPVRIRGRYFAWRNVYSLSVQVVATIALGVLLDASAPAAMRQRVREGAAGAAEVPGLVWLLMGAFTLSGLVGALDIWLFHRVREIHPRAPKVRLALREIVLGPLREQRFRRYVGSLATMTMGVALSMPFFGLLCQGHLGLDNLQTMVVLMLWGPLASVLASRAWGRAADRWGSRPILAINTVGIAVNVWLWMFVPAGSHLVAALVAAFSGVVWSGYGIARTNMEFSFVDRGGRSTYGASINVILALAGVVGGLLGGVLARASASLAIPAGPFTFINYHLVFLVSGVIRLMGVFWLIGMSDPGAKPVGVVARHLAQGLLHSVPTVLIMPLKLIRRPAASTRRR